MPDFETMDLHQTAVLWAKSTDLAVPYNEDGEVIVQDPVEVSCRWVQKNQQTVNAQGTPIGIEASVTIAQEVAVGSMMVLSTLAALTGSETKLYVATSNITTDIKHRRTRHQLGLSRYSDTVPELES